MDLLTQLSKPIQALITNSFQIIHKTWSFTGHKTLVLFIIAFSLSVMFVFGSATNSLSCMISLSMLAPMCALEIKDLLLRLEERGRLLDSVVELLGKIESNAAKSVAILCLASFILSVACSNVPIALQLVIFGIYHFNMIHPHSKLPELPLDSFLCCIISFSIIYLFFYSKAFKIHVCSLIYAVVSSFGLFSLLYRNITAEDNVIVDLLSFNVSSTAGYTLHIMVGASIAIQYFMRTILEMKRYLISKINNEILEK